MPFRYFEDFQPGTTHEYGATTVSRDEVIGFARQFDPQPFHLDEEAAKDTLLGGLAASGWHTCSILMRLNVDHVLAGSSCMGAPGVDEVRWLRPLRPGDTVRARMHVVDARASQSRPQMGVVSLRFELLNQNDEVVMTQANPIMFGRRPADAA
jgi:acyl dehydratase